MCLFVNAKRSQRYVKYHTKEKSKSNKIICYKHLCFDQNDNGDIELYSPYFDAIYEPGYMDSQESPYQKCSRDIINQGIHVYLKPSTTNFIVLRVVCDIKDFMGRDSDNEAAFTKVFVRKSDYQKAIKQAKAMLALE